MDTVSRDALEPREIVRWIDRRRTFAQFEVKLRRGHIAALAGLGDDLAALDGLAALHIELAVVGVGAHETIRMTYQHQITVPFELAAGISDDAALRRFDGSAFRHGDVDAVIAAGFEALDDPAARRPSKFRRNASRVGFRARYRLRGGLLSMDAAGRGLVGLRGLLRRRGLDFRFDLLFGRRFDLLSWSRRLGRFIELCGLFRLLCFLGLISVSGLGLIVLLVVRSLGLFLFALLVLLDVPFRLLGFRRGVLGFVAVGVGDMRMRRFGGARAIDRNDQPRTWTNLACAREAVRLEQSMLRHAEATRNDIDVFAVSDDDRRSARRSPIATEARDRLRGRRLDRTSRGWRWRRKSRNGDRALMRCGCVVRVRR